jgi:hypothetical protein
MSRLPVCLAISAFVALVALPAHAGPITVQANPLPGAPARCGQAGRVFESAQRDAFFTVYATNAAGKIIRPPVAQVFGNNLFINVPGVHNGQEVCDVKNVTNLQRFIILGAPDEDEITPAALGEEAHLDIESVVLNPDGTQTLESVFGRLAIERGFAPLRIPDLFSPTLEVLYSWVDIRLFMLTEPSFDFGDIFSIVNGETPLLPGMLFSETPFDFDPAIGPIYTPYTGDGEVISFHEVSAVPEPATLVLTGIGLATAGAVRRRRRSL